MKITATRKELDAYLDTISNVVTSVMSEDNYQMAANEVIATFHKGVDDGAVKIKVTPEQEYTVEVNDELVVKILDILSGYFSVLVPQVISLVNLTTSLGFSISDAIDGFRNKK